MMFQVTIEFNKNKTHILKYAANNIYNKYQYIPPTPTKK